MPAPATTTSAFPVNLVWLLEFSSWESENSGLLFFSSVNRRIGPRTSVSMVK